MLWETMPKVCDDKLNCKYVTVLMCLVGQEGSDWLLQELCTYNMRPLRPLDIRKLQSSFTAVLKQWDVRSCVHVSQSTDASAAHFGVILLTVRINNPNQRWLSLREIYSCTASGKLSSSLTLKNDNQRQHLRWLSRSVHSLQQNEYVWSRFECWLKRQTRSASFPEQEYTQVCRRDE